MSARAKVGDAQGEGGAWAPSPSAAEMWARAPAFRTTVLCMSNVNAGQGFPPPQTTGRDGGAGGAGAEPTRPLYTKWWFWLAATFAVVALVVIAQLLINGKGGGSSAEGEPGGSELTFPEFETQKFSGTGNDDISGLNVNELAAITFTCPECEGNVIVTADSDHDGLIINEIGSWSGTVLTGMIGNTRITQFMISADSDWTLTISDANSLPVVDDATHGTGTSAFVYTGDLTAATLTHDGSQNFIVTGRGADGAYSVVNEISPYNGTVPIEPGIIAVRADGDWTFTPTSDAPTDDADSRPTKDPAPESELEFPAFETQEFSGTGDDVITRLRDVEDRRGRRRHPRGEQQRPDTALEVGDAVLDDLGRRVADAGVDGTEVLEVESGCGDVSVVEDERGRLVDRQRAGAGGGVRGLSGVDLAGGEGPRHGVCSKECVVRGD